MVHILLRLQIKFSMLERLSCLNIFYSVSRVKCILFPYEQLMLLLHQLPRG